MALRRLFGSILAMLATGNAAADPIPQAELFTAFASDVSSGDPTIMAHVAVLLATPPTTTEGIGFYGLEAAPAPERVLRGIISALGNAGYILEVEDKALFETPAILQAAGVLSEIDPETDLGLMARIMQLLNDANSNQTDPDFVQILRRDYWAHVAAIDANARQNGRVVMQLHLPLGDTVYLWPANPEFEERWSGVELYRGPNTLQFARTDEVVMSIGLPDWEVYWGLLTYALLLPEDQSGLPPR